MSKRISGKVVYQNFSGGFWGIITDSGKEYRPVNFPDQLKKKGVRVDIVIKKERMLGRSRFGSRICTLRSRTIYLERLSYSR